MTVTDEPAADAAAAQCLRRYYAEIDERFEEGFDPDLYRDLSEFDPPRGAFLVMRVDGEPSGCGALAPFDRDSVYLKRMWVAPEVRGQGLGKHLLASLEAKARALGYRAVKLDTHKDLPEAQRLYRTSGYVEVAPFSDDPYANYWFEKPLD